MTPQWQWNKDKKLALQAKQQPSMCITFFGSFHWPLLNCPQQLFIENVNTQQQTGKFCLHVTYWKRLNKLIAVKMSVIYGNCYEYKNLAHFKGNFKAALVTTWCTWYWLTSWYLVLLRHHSCREFMAAFPVWKLRPLPSLKYDVIIKNVISK